MFERLRVDLLSAIRSLAATPVPVAAAIVTLAVAVGVNLAMFGLIDRAILSPAEHVVSPDRLFTIGIVPPESRPGSPPMTSTSYVGFLAIRDQVPALSSAAAFSRNAATVVINGEQREVAAMTISAEYFDTLGVRPMLGRGVHAGDESTSAAPPVVLSYAFWRAGLSGDGGVIGRRRVSGPSHGDSFTPPRG